MTWTILTETVVLLVVAGSTTTMVVELPVVDMAMFHRSARTRILSIVVVDRVDRCRTGSFASNSRRRPVLRVVIRAEAELEREEMDDWCNRGKQAVTVASSVDE